MLSHISFDHITRSLARQHCKKAFVHSLLLHEITFTFGFQGPIEAMGGVGRWLSPRRGVVHVRAGLSRPCRGIAEAGHGRSMMAVIAIAIR
jgi:hypothetical protein